MTNVINKRYLVFAGYKYYPEGGWSEFVMATDDPLEAIARAEETVNDENAKGERWSHVIDLRTSLPIFAKPPKQACYRH